MKFFIILALISCVGCAPQAEEPLPCGYEAVPYHNEPVSCRDNLYSLIGGECCIWKKDNCLETWCYNSFLCKWQLTQYNCAQ